MGFEHIYVELQCKVCTFVHICVELQTVHIWVSSTFVLIPNVEVLCTFVLNCNVCTFGFRAERNRVFSKPPSFLIPASH